MGNLRGRCGSSGQRPGRHGGRGLLLGQGRLRRMVASYVGEDGEFAWQDLAGGQSWSRKSSVGSS